MSREVFNLKAAAGHVKIDANELRHIAQRGEIRASQHGGDWWFEHRDLDEWAQRDLLARAEKEQDARHSAFVQAMPKGQRAEWRVADLFREDAIDVQLGSKTKGGAVRDMADLAISSGLVYDGEGFYKALVEREEAASTAIGHAAAFLHPKYHDPYFFEDTFVAYARARRDVFFGAPGGEGTRHFFLVCCTDHDLHLRILARLAVLAHGTDLMERLDAVATPHDVLEAVRLCENEILAC